MLEKQQNTEPEIKGKSKRLASALKTLKKIASSRLPVVIVGESGVGKEKAAKLVHYFSKRSDKVFEVRSCANLTKEQIESDLFGHVRGAFTGAVKDRKGAFELAHGGTLFLDEIGELPLELQSRLLRTVQEGEIFPMGATTSKKVDVRLVSATNRNLADMVSNGEFREDLYYRLKGCKVELPPLRERGRDALLLARHFIKQGKTVGEISENSHLARDTTELLLSYDWPGNIRELKNVIETAAQLSGRTIRSDDIRPLLEFSIETSTVQGVPAREKIVELLKKTSSASTGELEHELKIPRTTLHRLLNALISENRIERFGKARTCRYRLSRGQSKKQYPNSSPTKQCLSEPESLKKQSLSPRQYRCLDHLKKNGRITRKEYVGIALVSEKTANRDLKEMIKKGLLKSEGKKGRSSGYILVQDTESHDASS